MRSKTDCFLVMQAMLRAAVVTLRNRTDSSRETRALASVVKAAGAARWSHALNHAFAIKLAAALDDWASIVSVRGTCSTPASKGEHDFLKPVVDLLGSVMTDANLTVTQAARDEATALHRAVTPADATPTDTRSAAAPVIPKKTKSTNDKSNGTTRERPFKRSSSSTGDNENTNKRFAVATAAASTVRAADNTRRVELIVANGEADHVLQQFLREGYTVLSNDADVFVLAFAQPASKPGGVMVDLVNRKSLSREKGEKAVGNIVSSLADNRDDRGRLTLLLYLVSGSDWTTQMVRRAQFRALAKMVIFFEK